MMQKFNEKKLKAINMETININIEVKKDFLERLLAFVKKHNDAVTVIDCEPEYLDFHKFDKETRDSILEAGVLIGRGDFSKFRKFEKFEDIFA
jgi:hypothetical protein